MISSITNGVKVSVTSNYEGKNERAEFNSYIFTYNITVENQTDVEIKLLSRKWFIFDSCGTVNEVEGMGVVGKQPRLMKGQSFNYSSWCPIHSEIGSMRGFYTMVNLQTNTEFGVEIPCFQLIVPYRLN